MITLIKFVMLEEATNSKVCKACDIAIWKKEEGIIITMDSYIVVPRNREL
jgi:hypothetical protein